MYECTYAITGKPPYVCMYVCMYVVYVCMYVCMYVCITKCFFRPAGDGKNVNTNEKYYGDLLKHVYIHEKDNKPQPRRVSLGNRLMYVYMLCIYVMYVCVYICLYLYVCMYAYILCL